MPAKIQTCGTGFEEYLRDESRRSGNAEHIVFARSEADVRSALSAARQNSWPVTVQGARTGVTAGAVPQGGLILNMSRMNFVEPLCGNHITVQPGAPLTAVRAATQQQNLLFPPDPTETSASLGGMLACNASGAQSFLYGPVRNWVHALRVVLTDGDVLRLERGIRAVGLAFTLKTESGRTLSGRLPELRMPAVKSAAGYFIQPDMELIDLFIGMEGTLGIITEAELKLIPSPPVQQALCAFFAEESAALRFVRFLRGEESGSPALRPAAIEFFDHGVLNLLRRSKAENSAFAGRPELPECPRTAVYAEFHSSSKTAVEEAVATSAERMTELGADENECWLADGPREMETQKLFRHAAPEAVNLLIDQRKKKHPGLTKLGTDMSVPDDALEVVMQMYRSGLTDAGLEHVIFGHIGNNHVHVNILPRNMEELARGKELYLDWAGKITALGGSVSAEHGIGKIKVPLLRSMLGADGIAAMRRVKQMFDPAGLLNLGNLFETEEN